MNNEIFLTDDEIRQLTGFARKSKQIAHLKRMGILFFMNKNGAPVIPRANIQVSEPKPRKTGWQPHIH